MTICHHPSTDTLVRHAAGTLEAGPAVVVAAHMTLCHKCRACAANFRAVGGALLNELPPAPMERDALALTLAKIDAAKIDANEPTPALGPQLSAPPMPAGIALPAPLLAQKFGRWRWLAPGIRWSRPDSPRDVGSEIVLLRIGPNKKLPAHGHTGIEFTQVIFGSFSDGRSRYFPGDMVEADSEVEHQPVVDRDGECICVAAINGQMRFHGFVWRLLQPFVDF